jgi:hypothetical protein
MIISFLARAELIVEPTAVDARAKVLEWAESLKSFEGLYSLVQSHPQDVDAEPIEMQIEYRFQDENWYLNHSMLNNEKKTINHIEAMWKGDMQSLHRIIQGKLVLQESGIVNRQEDARLFPPGALITPEKLFGKLRTLPDLKTFMSSGYTYLFERDGQSILRHYDGKLYAVDIWLSENASVKRYDVSFAEFLPDVVKAHYKGDFFEIRWLLESLELSDYRDLEGVSFPTRAVLTAWEPDPGIAEQIVAETKEQNLEPIDRFIRKCTQVELFPNMLQEFKLDVPSARVNAELTETSFRISYPEKIVMFNSKGSRIDPRPFWRRTWFLASVAACIVFAGIGGIVFKGRRKYL